VRYIGRGSGVPKGGRSSLEGKHERIAPEWVSDLRVRPGRCRTKPNTTLVGGQVEAMTRALETNTPTDLEWGT